MTFMNKKRKNIQTEARPTNCFLVKLSGKVLGSLQLIALLCACYESAEGVLVQKPNDTTVIANKSTFFNCSKSYNTSNEPTWYHHPLVGPRQDVYDQEKIRVKYKDRFSIDKNITSGAFNLLVQRPETTDAGRFECVVDFVKDTGASAELTVLDSNLVCKSDKELNDIVGPTECANPIAPDQLQLSCSVTYSGNNAPQMEWRKVGSELHSNEIKCGVSGNRVNMCNATLEGNLNMQGSVYVCQITAAEQYNCSLKINKTIYAFSDTSMRTLTLTEEANCSANTSKDLPCSYKWYKDNKTLPFGQTLKPSEPGLYRCEAECRIRNETCSFTAMVINVPESAMSRPTTDTSDRNLLWLLVLVIPLGVIVAVLVYCFRKKSCRSQPIKRSSPPGPPAVQIPLLPARNESNEMDEENAIRKACEDARFIGRGLNGNIRGPGEHKGKQCAYEEILFTHDQQTLRNKEGMTEVEKVLGNGDRWRKLKHENLIKIHDIILKSQTVYIVIEYAAGRSLRKELKNLMEDLLVPVVKDWATQIAQGLKFLHEKGIVHKNIKSSQIFILDEIKEPSDISNKTLKIGCLNFLDNDSIYDGTSFEQNEPYWPPEVITGRKYSGKSDVWSFSMVILEILTRKLPYETGNLEIPILCPEELTGILIECRTEEPSKRPTFIEIVNRLQEWQL